MTAGPGSFVIRPVGADDRARWMPLWRGYQKFYRVEIADAVTDKTFARFLDPAEPMHGLVAEAGTALIGLVHFLYHRSTWTDGPYCYLQDLFTAERVRGTGVGRALIEAVYARAKDDGAVRVYWLTHETNATAMQLYDRIADRSGFVQYRKVL